MNTCDLDKDSVLSYAAMRYNLEEEMKNFDFPSKEEMVATLQEKNVGLDFKTGKQTINNKTNIDKLKLYYLADHLGKNLGDISKVEKLPYADLVTYSFPCFVPGTMVLTDNGYKNIEDIQEGDMVLTHTNQYQKVVKPMKNYCNSYVYKINAMCSDPIYTTEEHPFYVRKKYYKYSLDCVYENGKEKRQRLFTEPEWIKAKDLTKDYYVGIAINQKSEIPKWDGMTFHWSDGRGDRHSNKLGQYMDKRDFWWIIGRYLGDGWLVDGYGKNPSYGIKICCANNETKEITTVLDRLGMHYTTSTERTVNKIQLSSKELYTFCSQFGRGAANKHLTSVILNLPTDLLKSFLDGYISADGSFTQNKYKVTSVSKELIYGIGQCVAKAYHTPFSVYKVTRPKTCVIEGRTVNQKDSYDLTFMLDRQRAAQAFYEDGYIWCHINSITTEDYDGYVYNMEVENDNSYVVQNIIVHNCTDLSVAGKGEGMVNKCDTCGYSWPIDFSNVEETVICPECGATVSSSTRSGLLGQVQRLLSVAKENNTLPKYLLLENVKNLVGKKFIGQFEAWVKWLDSIGYNTSWKVLNGKHYDIPQNRERVFAISIRKDIDTKSFIFPETIPLTTRLKDMLEKNVDERFYLPDDRIEKILNSSFMQEKKFKCLSETEDTSPIRIGNIYDENYGTGYAGNVWDTNGVSPTLQTAQGGNRMPLVLDEIKVVGNYMPSNHDASRVVDIDGIAPTVKENHGTVTAIAEPFIVASRGRNPGNPSDRTVGAPTEQRLEPNFSGCTNTLTSVQKDNYVAEPIVCEERKDEGIRLFKDDCVGTLRTIDACGDKRVLEPEVTEPPKVRWRIRKLTPKECWRLMGFTDEDHNRAAKYTSASARYKMAGNSIITSVLIALFSSLLIPDGHKSEVWTKYLLHFDNKQGELYGNNTK